MTASAVSVTILDGTSGSDIINGGDGNEILVGRAGADTLNGGGGDDTLYAGELSPPWGYPTTDYYYYSYPVLDHGTDVDTLNGGAGIDLIFSGYGDKVDGGADGADLLISLAGASAGVTANFGSLGDGGTLTIGGGLIQNIRSVLWVEGSNFNDVITGGPQSGLIFGLDGNDHLVAGSESSWIAGGNGDDTIDSAFSGGTYYGNDGNDLIRIIGSSTFDRARVYGGDGNDEIHATGLIYGGLGDDVILAPAQAQFALTASGDDGYDTLEGGDQKDTLVGGYDGDVIEGGDGDDILMSEGSSYWQASWADWNEWIDYGLSYDQLKGGDGDDIIYAGYGDDVDGGTGNDYLILAMFGAWPGVTLNVADLETPNPFKLGGGTIQRVEHISMLFGSNYDDVLTLSQGIPVYGMDGDDRINGSLLADDIYGGYGNDTLNGSDGADHIHGGSGADIIDGGTGDDTIFIDDASDLEPGEQIRGGDGVDTLMVKFPDYSPWSDVSLAGVSLSGVEVLSSEQSRMGVSTAQLTNVTTLVGAFQLETAGAVSFAGKSTPYSVDVTLNSGGNNLFLGTFNGAATVTGSDVKDIVDGSAFADQVYGGGGDDEIGGRGGDDWLVGGAGNDWIDGDYGNDSLFGGEGFDHLDGGAGDDRIDGVESYFSPYGNAGDLLIGGDGDDYILAGYGDNVEGGPGTDKLSYFAYGAQGGVTADFSPITSGGGIYSIAGFTFSGIEEIVGITGTDFADVLVAGPLGAAARIDAGGGDDQLIGGSGANALYGDAGDDVISGGSGNDQISGGSGNDRIDGDEGDDTLIGDDGSDHLDGGAGNDQLNGIDYYYGSQPSDALNGGEGDDFIWADLGDLVDGGSGNDKLNYTAWGATAGVVLDFSQVSSGGAYSIGGLTFTGIEELVGISGSNFNDVIVAGPLGASAQISGGYGDDQLIGGSGANSIDGGSGEDVLSGGLGADTLYGGDGSDLFKDTAAGFNGDTVVDLFTRNDRIVITDASIGGFTFNLSGNTLTFSGGTLTLNAVEHGHLIASAAAGGGVELRLIQQPVHNNFDGGYYRYSDVLWQNSNGTVRDWLGQYGSFVGNIGKVNILTGPEWHVIGTGDFNGDGMTDVLWKHNNGTVRDWLGQSDGSFVGNIAKVNILSTPDWHAVGTGDFNGDGRDDVLWQNDNGTVREWLGQADATFAGNIAHVNFVPAAGQHIVGTGDFNGDGRADILWHSDAGVVTDWLGQADGSFVDNSANVAINTGPTWHVIGTGDFNGDGYSDILWRNIDGTIREWLGQANGGFIGNTAHVNFVPGAGQRVVGIGDYNGDGYDDLLWQSTAGVVTQSLGLANGGFVANPYVNITTGTEWRAQDPFVHDLFA